METPVVGVVAVVSVDCLGVSVVATGASLTTLFTVGVFGAVAAALPPEEGSTNLGGTKVNESIMNGTMVGILDLSALGYIWNKKTSVPGHSINILNDILAYSGGGSDGL